ncbi:MAG: hypothetical protein QOK13_746 [Gaiellaceae bacterium]|jgi:hypothetical protein|nr:hypothetical protein [Gaiellaceae bacterium]
MRPPRRLVAAVIAALALGAASTATAQFTNPATAGPMSLASATLAPPTAVTAIQTNCKNGKPPTNTVGWTATSSAFATGYRIERATTSGGPYSLVASVAIATTSYLDADPALASSTTYYYRAVSTYQSWTNASGQVALTTLSNKCL